MFEAFPRQTIFSVAPFTGAWIEIDDDIITVKPLGDVAPFTGAWIEMVVPVLLDVTGTSRTLHGCVD